jgi:hypothetical protein
LANADAFLDAYPAPKRHARTDPHPDASARYIHARAKPDTYHHPDSDPIQDFYAHAHSHHHAHAYTQPDSHTKPHTYHYPDCAADKNIYGYTSDALTN